ncbi:uncharacterized protein [Ptychodera flava]|uniref:uncharacterized protein isoform X2 n=1 Tax=Ptychodera flava TaxID=63121 RepID=UPI00396A1460
MPSSNDRLVNFSVQCPTAHIIQHGQSVQDKLYELKNTPIASYQLVGDNVDIRENDMKSCFPVHIPHQYENEAKKPSECVMLGVLQKNEQYAEQMIEIARYAHQYVPGCFKYGEQKKGSRSSIPLTGDQLTVERLREALDSVCDGRTPDERLEGLYPKLADWHALVCFYKVLWNRLYSTKSSRDTGTMHQIRNAVNRRNVCNDPSVNFNSSKDFLEIYTEAHIISALLSYFGMESVDAELGSESFVQMNGSVIDKKKSLYDALGAFVDKFVMGQIPVIESQNEDESAADLLKCRFCGKKYKRESFLTKYEKEKHGDSFYSEATTQSPIDQSQDGVFNYACTSLSLGLFARNFQDAVKEGDGDRVIRMYKFLMLHYKSDGRHKYALESLYLLVQIAAILPPRDAHLLKWERFVNVNGGQGRNISLDLHLEHQNKYFKEDVKSFGGKLTEKAVNRVSRAAHSTEKILKNLDLEIKLDRPSGHHTVASNEKDLSMIVDNLHNNGRVFNFTPGRFHPSFPSFTRDPFNGLDVSKIKKWISKHLLNFEEKYSYL